MATYIAPGVYLQNVSTPAFTPGGLTGRVSAILGTAPKGPVLSPLVFLSAADAYQSFGDPSTANPGYTIPIAIQAFFSQAGQGFGISPGLIVRRVGTTQATGTIPGTSGSVALVASDNYGGADGNSISVQVAAPVFNPSTSVYATNVSVYNGGGGIGSFENYQVLDSTPTGTLTDSEIYQALLQSQIVTSSGYVAGVFPTPGTYTLSGGTTGLGQGVVQSDIDALQNPDVLCDDVQVLQGDINSSIAVLAHCELVSSETGAPRIGWGGPNFNDSVSTITTNVASVASPDGRFVYCGHDGVQMVNPLSNGVSVQPGWLLTTMMMGANASLPAGTPLTFKNIFQIKGVNTPLNLSQMNSLAGAGCMLITKGPGGGWVVRDDTTTTSPAGISEFSYLVNRTSLDIFVKRLYAYAFGHLIGQPGGSSFPQKVVSGFTAVGAQAAQDGIIDSIGAINPTQNRNDPTQWTVVVSCVQRGEIRVIYLNLATAF